MLISTAAVRALADAGVTLIPRGPDVVELIHDGSRAVLPVVSSARPLGPRDIAALISRDREPYLVVVPAASPTVRRAIEEAGWSWLVDTGQEIVAALRIGRRRVDLPAPAVAGPPARPGPVPWGTFTLVRRLVQIPHATQRQLAALSGVSQPRVSQALRALADKGLVQRTSAGWAIRDLDEALRWWLATYPGPGGISTYWYGLGTPIDQAQRAVSTFATTYRSGIVVSGDVAADLLAPWRTPARAVLYARTGIDLPDAGYVPTGAEEATLEFTVPKDPGLWPDPAAPPTKGAGLPLADPLQILWDVRRSPGADSDDAVQHLWDELRRRHHERRQAA
ncbi:MarR family transcriptional regulator [Melissospora conviva]|uniref:MarR family transcriptional regulator n=1 Tax=Melissospora conviva TaxID=3388432 RepID=UPI003C28D970